MKTNLCTVLLLVAASFAFPVGATVAADPVHAPQLTVSCLDFHINADKSVDLTCKIQNTETGLGPVIKGVVLRDWRGSSFASYPAGDIADGGIAKVSLHYLPNQYQSWAKVASFPNFHHFDATGIANDAMFGNIISHFFPAITGQNVNSNALVSNDPQQPPQFWMPGGCTYEATLSQTPLNFPYSGGSASLVVDAQPSALSAPKGCPWVAATMDGAAGIATFTTGGSTPAKLGPGAAPFKVLPNVVLNASSQPRTYALDVIPSFIGMIFPYHGRFQFTQDGLTCTWAASGFTAPQQGIPANSPATITVKTQTGCQWSVPSASANVMITDGTTKVVTGNGGVRYSVSPNLTATARTLQIKLGNITVTAVQPGLPLISATVRTNPAGLSITVDGKTYTASQTFQWPKGTPHTIGGTSQQRAIGTLYVFSSWSQGGSQNQTVSPAADATFTENFTTEYQVTTAVSPAGSGNVSLTSGAFVNAGTTIRLSATPASGYTFASWTGPVAASGSLNTTVMVNAPLSLTANFVRTLKTTSHAASPAEPATIPLRIHAGGPAYTDVSGNTWSEDTGFSGGTAATVDTAIAGTPNPALYQSERSSADPFEYRLAVPNGDYSVKLRFAELHYRTRGNRLFNVSINGQSALTNFDPATVAGASFTAVDQQFPATVSDGGLVIRFDPVLDAATVSGIEVVPAFSPIRVRAGDPAADAPNGFSISTTATIAGTGTPELCQSARSAASGFKYEFHLPNGAYMVRLKFAEIQYDAPGQRTFNVSLNGNQVLSNFDPVMAAGGAFKAIDKQFQASVSDERLMIRFDPVRGAPIVNAIEVVPFTAIRLRAGGASYNDANGQAWSGDYNYSAGAVLSTGAPIAATSDAGLYQTQRNAPGGFDYQFAVPDGNYTVVLHFAEILNSFGPGSRVFNVSINGAPVLMNFDVAASAGGDFRALERSFPVTVNAHQVTIHFDAVVDAPIVNAIEVLSVQ